MRTRKRTSLFRTSVVADLRFPTAADNVRQSANTTLPRQKRAESNVDDLCVIRHFNLRTTSLLVPILTLEITPNTSGAPQNHKPILHFSRANPIWRPTKVVKEVCCPAARVSFVGLERKSVTNRCRHAHIAQGIVPDIVSPDDQPDQAT